MPRIFTALPSLQGFPLNETVNARKALRFYPSRDRILRYPQGSGASLVPGDKQLTIIDGQSDSPNLDPQATLFTSCQSVRDYRWRQSINTLQRFAHRYAIAVLMANAGAGSALWDEKAS